MLEIREGRPEELSGRLPKEIKVYDFLDELGIFYERVDHEPLMTMEACEEADRALGTPLCKNLLLRNRQATEFYLLMMPGNKKFKTKELSAQIGTARLSFAEPEYMEGFLDITPGSLSVMGLMNDRENRVKLLIDEDVLKETYVCMHPCINTGSLKISTEALLRVFLPAVRHGFTRVTLFGED